ncbi:MAG: hypothetical protein JOZ04_14475 [Acidimicrobiia bacterium]|nr:hypothetical protein [Acidimicrobiia bacterium]
MSTVETATKAPAAKATGSEKPIVVVDLGRRSRKQVKRLRRGEGRLMERVDQTIDQLRAEKEIDPNSEVVVFVVKEKDRRKGIFL